MDSITRIGTERHWAGRMNLHVDTLPYAQLSFSLSGEDAVLAQHFKRRIHNNKPGIYVDLGCAMPVQISNTYLFYCHGWRGVCVDLNPKHAPYWASARPEDAFVNAVVSNETTTAHIFEHASNEGMLRIGTSEMPPSPEFRHVGQATPLSLADILAAKLKPGTVVDFFSIDVEGAELSVLKSNDWNRWKPAVILVECEGYSPSEQEPEAIAYLRTLGYSVSGNIGANVFLSL